MTVKPSPGFHLQTTDRHRQSSRQCCWSWILFHCRLDLWWIEPIKCALLAWDSSVFLVACNSHDTVYTAKTDDADFDERERIIEMNWKTTWSVSLKNIGAGRTYYNILLACTVFFAISIHVSTTPTQWTYVDTYSGIIIMQIHVHVPGAGMAEPLYMPPPICKRIWSKQFFKIILQRLY